MLVRPGKRKLFLGGCEKKDEELEVEEDVLFWVLRFLFMLAGFVAI